MVIVADATSTGRRGLRSRRTSSSHMASGQWAAEILDLFLCRSDFAGVDFQNPDSVRLLSEDHRTVLLESLEGPFNSWMWATISMEWIQAMMVTHEGAIAKTRILDEEPARDADDRRDRVLDIIEGLEDDELMRDVSPVPSYSCLRKNKLRMRR